MEPIRESLVKGKWDRMIHPEVELYLAPDRDKAGLSYASQALDGKAPIITPQSLDLTNDASLDWCDLLAVAPPEETPAHDLDAYQALIAQISKAEQRLKALDDTPLDETTQAKAEAFFAWAWPMQSQLYERLNHLQKASVLSVHQ
jgi:DNA primase